MHAERGMYLTWDDGMDSCLSYLLRDLIEDESPRSRSRTNPPIQPSTNPPTQHRGAEYTTAHIGPLEGTSPAPPPNGTDPDNPDYAPAMFLRSTLSMSGSGVSGLGAEAEVVDLESYRRWFLVHVLGAYYMTAVVLFLLWRSYQEYLQLRHAFRQRPAPENCAWAGVACLRR